MALDPHTKESRRLAREDNEKRMTELATEYGITKKTVKVLVKSVELNPLAYARLQLDHDEDYKELEEKLRLTEKAYIEISREMNRERRLREANAEYVSIDDLSELAKHASYFLMVDKDGNEKRLSLNTNS